MVQASLDRLAMGSLHVDQLSLDAGRAGRLWPAVCGSVGTGSDADFVRRSGVASVIILRCAG